MAVQIGKKQDSSEIGQMLYISKNIVDTHRRNIIRKLECKNSEHAYLKAKNIGLL
jgi:DNA-binding CsgD family transcriptional regulator